jgi:hypothetical protein
MSLPLTLTRTWIQSASDTFTTTWTLTATKSLEPSPSDSGSLSTTLEDIRLRVSPAVVRRSAIRSGSDAERSVTFSVHGTIFDPSHLNDQFLIFENLRFDVLTEERQEPDSAYQLRDTMLVYNRASLILYRTKATFTFPQTPNYFAVYDEVLNITFGRKLFASRRSEAWILLTIQADSPSLTVPPELATAVGYLASLTTAFGGFTSGAGDGSMSVLPMLVTPWGAATVAVSRCEFQIGEPLPWYQHPFYVGLNSDRTRYHAGAIVFNTVLVVAVALIHLAVSHFVFEHRPLQQQTFFLTTRRLLFPQVELMVAAFLWQPTIRSALTVALHAPEPELIALGAVMLSVWLLASCILFGFVLLRFGSLYIFKRNPTGPKSRRGRKSSAAARRSAGGTLTLEKSQATQQPNQEEPSGVLPHVFEPDGVWEDDDFFHTRNIGFTAKFGCIYVTQRSSRHWFFLCDFGLGFTIAVLESIHPKQFQCTAMDIVLFLSMFIQFAAVCILRPYSTIFNHIVVLPFLFVGSIGALMLALSDATEVGELRIVGTWLFFVGNTLLAIFGFVRIGVWGVNTFNRVQRERQRRQAEIDAEELRRFVDTRHVGAIAVGAAESTGKPVKAPATPLAPPTLQQLLLEGSDPNPTVNGEGLLEGEGEGEELLLRHRVPRHGSHTKKKHDSSVIPAPPGHLKAAKGLKSEFSDDGGDAATPAKAAAPPSAANLSLRPTPRKPIPESSHQWVSDDDTDIIAARTSGRPRVVGAAAGGSEGRRRSQRKGTGDRSMQRGKRAVEIDAQEPQWLDESDLSDRLGESTFQGRQMMGSPPGRYSGGSGRRDLTSDEEYLLYRYEAAERERERQHLMYSSPSARRPRGTRDEHYWLQEEEQQRWGAAPPLLREDYYEAPRSRVREDDDYYRLQPEYHRHRRSLDQHHHRSHRRSDQARSAGDSPSRKRSSSRHRRSRRSRGRDRGYGSPAGDSASWDDDPYGVYRDGPTHLVMPTNSAAAPASNPLTRHSAQPQLQSQPTPKNGGGTKPVAPIPLPPPLPRSTTPATSAPPVSQQRDPYDDL